MTVTSGEPVAAVVGADGFVGAALARALGARRVVYGPPGDGETHVASAESLIRRADVVVNAGGFRVRPGCGLAEYRASHQGSTERFVPWIRPGALLLHVSSSSVLGVGVGLGNRTPPNPGTFPSPAYAQAKAEQDAYLEQASAERGFRVQFLRPAAVYSEQGAGMVDTLLRLARKGIALRLYPREARHHLVHMDLVAEAARRIVARPDLPNLGKFVVADPYTVTSRQLEELIRPALRKGSVVVPLPVHWLAGALALTFHARDPRLDLKTQGEVFGVLCMDTVYDPSETFRTLGLKESDYTLEKTLLPVVEKALRS